MGMESEEVPIPDGHTRKEIPQRRTLAEIRYQAAALRAKRERRSKIVGGLVAIVFGALILASTVAVLAALFGGAYWILTGEPIF